MNKLKGVSLDPKLLNKTVTDHAKKLGMIEESETLVVTTQKIDFKKESDFE